MVTISPKQEVKYRDTARFNCTFSGNPRPTISWSFDNNTLTSSQKHNITTSGNHSILLVNDLGRADSGTYGCRANNSVANVERSSELLVLSKLNF